MHRIFVIILLGCLSISVQAANRQIILDVGNDYFTLPRHTDRYLTHNMTLGVVHEGLPGFLESYEDRFEESVHLVSSWSLSQFMYTPEKTEWVIPDPNDQPYAAWLFLSGSVGVRKLKELFLYEVQVGLVGPSALGKETQNFYHDFIGVDQAQGWDSQLHDEFGMNLMFTYALLGYRTERPSGADNDDWGGDFVYGGGGSVGNVDTHAELSALIRWGLNVPDDMGYRAGAPREKAWSFYGFLRGQQRLVIRDIFLDGNSDGQSPSVEKRNLLSLGSVGACLGYDGFEFSYSFDAGTKRFKAQSTAESRGSLSFSYSRTF